MTLRSTTGASNVTLGVKDVETGEFYSWVGNIYREERLLEQVRSTRSKKTLFRAFHGRDFCYVSTRQNRSLC